ncbi:hypothetical protein OIV83_002126 [Microbotryomycetes sp. JL201]|nr:hypothetical protein OIV83_002126 [Microbotryomycetes sp. JL201]
MASFKTTLRQQLSLIAQNAVDRRRNGASECMDEQDVLAIVNAAMQHATAGAMETEMLPQWLKDSRRTIVDSSLEQMALSLNPDPATEDEVVAFGALNDALDVILTFAEQGHADDTCPLNVITLLMDLQTVDGCVHLFRWIESRVDRVTKGMQPLRGKGPILLRLSNELLRRLPKTKQEHVVFSGQVLMFLNSVFPLGEKSGVNLRGNFNVGKVTVFDDAESGAGAQQREEDEEGTGDFYHAFWSLQRYFSNPALLFENATTLESLKMLQSGMSRTLAAFSEATKQERRLAGSSKAGKRKAAAPQTDAEIETSLEQYFFPKYLTSRNLLELEIADTSFRRQVLFQALILFQYMLSFVPAERDRLRLRTTNLSALPNYVLAPESEKWVRELRAKSLAELDAMEGGRRFRQTIELISRREQNWINWKLKSCFSFEKPPLAADRSDVARNKLKLMSRKPKSFMHALGNANLSRTWQRNTTSLDEFEPELIDDEFDNLFRQWKMSTKAVQMRKAALEQAKTASASSKVFELEAEIEQLEIKIKAVQWRAVRALARTNMSILNKAGSADLNVIMDTMEKQRRLQEEKEEKEAAQKEAQANGSGADQKQTEEEEHTEAANGTEEGIAAVESAAGTLEGDETAKDHESSGDDAQGETASGGEVATIKENGKASAETDTAIASPLPTSPSGKRKHSEANEDVDMDDGASEAKKLKVEDETA